MKPKALPAARLVEDVDPVMLHIEFGGEVRHESVPLVEYGLFASFAVLAVAVELEVSGRRVIGIDYHSQN